MNRRFFDWIWHISGSLPLSPEQSNAEDAFDRLDSLFRQRGTTYRRTHDTLTFQKRNQAPQDKMSIFDDGVLHIRKGVGGSVLDYRLSSRALLLCFLAPLLFLSFAQFTGAIGTLDQSSDEPASEESEKEETALPQNSIDKALGAPAPEKPEEEGADKSDDEDDTPSPTAAYVFAALFAILYVVGRVLEARLVRTLFKKSLLGSWSPSSPSMPDRFSPAASPATPVRPHSG